MNVAEPRHHRFEVSEYVRMVEAGILSEGDRVELIDGEVVEMAAVGTPHCASVSMLTRFLVTLFGNRAVVRVQSPLRISDFDMPEPDVAVCHPRDDFYAHRYPTGGDVYLVVEVADSSLRHDRTTKAALYARGGVPEYWIVDLGAARVEVFREPSGGGWGSVETYGRDRELAAPGADGATVRVTDLLP